MNILLKLNKAKLVVFFTCLIFTGGHFYFKNFVFQKNSIQELLSLGGDEVGYVNGSESFFKGGDHYFYRTDKRPLKSNFIKDGEYDLGLYYCFRTPGYSFVFMPLRIFLSYEQTLIAILFLQVFLISVIKFLICLLAYRFCEKSKLALVISLIVTNLFLFTSRYNDDFLTEPFAISFLVLSFWFLLKAEKTARFSLFGFSGILFLIAAMLRPFLLPVLSIYCFIYLQKNKFNFIKTAFSKQVLFFVLPTVLFLGGWAIRNYDKTGEVILVAKTTEWDNYTNKGFQQALSLVKNIGADHVWWSHENLTNWYINRKSKLDILSFKRIASLPDEHIIRLRESRSFCLKSLDSLNLSLKVRKQYELKAEVLLLPVNSYINGNNFYGLVIPVETFFANMKVPSESFFRRFDNFYPFNVIITWAEFWFNRFVLLLGLIGGVYFLIKGTNKTVKLFVWTQLFVIGFFSYYGVREIREVYIPSVLSLLPASMFLSELIKSKRFLILSVMFFVVAILAYYDTLVNMDLFS